MIVAPFICGPGDECWLPHHFRVLSSLVDQVFVIFDRCTAGPQIAARWPRVQWREQASADESIGMASDGPTWDEGKLRQVAWDWATECRPDYVLLADADEVPSPAAAAWLNSGFDDATNVWYADWINLVHDAGHAIGGPACAWSYQNTQANKKGLLVKYRPGAEYRYRQATRHVRMEPTPRNEFRTVYDKTHVMGGVPLVHYQWANWPRWQASARARLPYFATWPPADGEIVDVPRSWLWQWDADQLIARLPERLAVVGNGPVTGRGAEIDSHAAVIRLNNWRTDGFEEHVGQRTDAWCTNCWEDVAMRPWTGDMLTVTTDECQYARNSAWLGCYPHMHIPRQSWVRACRAIHPENPSTGLVLLHRLAEIGKQVDAYGFGGMRGGHYWNAADRMTPDHRDERPAMEKLADRIRFR